MRPAPWIEEERRQEALEMEHRKYLRGCPWCCICDEQIAEPKCIQLEEGNFDACAHEECYDKELRKMRRSGLSPFMVDTIDNLLFEAASYITTPHNEGMEG